MGPAALRLVRRLMREQRQHRAGGLAGYGAHRGLDPLLELPERRGGPALII